MQTILVCDDDKEIVEAIEILPLCGKPFLCRCVLETVLDASGFFHGCVCGGLAGVPVEKTGSPYRCACGGPWYDRIKRTENLQ